MYPGVWGLTKLQRVQETAQGTFRMTTEVAEGNPSHYRPRVVLGHSLSPICLHAFSSPSLYHIGLHHQAEITRGLPGTVSYLPCADPGGGRGGHVPSLFISKKVRKKEKEFDKIKTRH